MAPLDVLEIPAGQRDAWWPLLRLADDADDQIRAYVDDGCLFGVVEAGRPVAHVLTIAVDDGSEELRNVAVATDRQGTGLGRRLVVAVLERLRARGVRRAKVGTASSSLGALRFYLRLGFRPYAIDRDYFGPAKGYAVGLEEEGILVRDMIWLDLEL